MIRRAPVVISGGILRVSGYRLIIVADGPGVLTQSAVGIAAVVIRGDIVRVDSDCLVIIVDSPS